MESAVRNSLAILSVTQGAEFEGSATFARHYITYSAYNTEFNENFLKVTEVH
jgi:hypothetical protein